MNRFVSADGDPRWLGSSPTMARYWLGSSPVVVWFWLGCGLIMVGQFENDKLKLEK
jgi:hypothetical protein